VFAGQLSIKKKLIVVEDVHQFPGHIACDSRSNSEIVVPFKNRDGEIIGVLDVDSSKHKAAFSEVDAKLAGKNSGVGLGPDYEPPLLLLPTVFNTSATDFVIKSPKPSSLHFLSTLSEIVSSVHGYNVWPVAFKIVVVRWF
jgi:hypothetical protein